MHRKVHFLCVMMCRQGESIFALVTVVRQFIYHILFCRFVSLSPNPVVIPANQIAAVVKIARNATVGRQDNATAEISFTTEASFPVTLNPDAVVIYTIIGQLSISSPTTGAVTL